MGSKCAPSVACLYMPDFEERYVYSYVTQLLLWKRYIGDIFIIGTHGDTALDYFVSYLNNCHPLIKFTVTKSTLQVDFLDLIVKTKNGISTELFNKRPSSLAYLYSTSCHPRHVFTSLPYGEFLKSQTQLLGGQHFWPVCSPLKTSLLHKRLRSPRDPNSPWQSSSLGQDQTPIQRHPHRQLSPRVWWGYQWPGRTCHCRKTLFPCPYPPSRISSFPYNP